MTDWNAVRVMARDVLSGGAVVFGGVMAIAVLAGLSWLVGLGYSWLGIETRNNLVLGFMTLSGLFALSILVNDWYRNAKERAQS